MDDLEYQGFEEIIERIAGEPMLEPTSLEFETLALAMAEVKLPCDRTEVVPARSFGEFAGFVTASIAAFFMVFTMLALASFGKVDVVSAVRAVGPVWLALAGLVIVFLTSFVPVFITARRRPLNGLTFKA